MIELNLSTSNHEQEKIKAFLQNNVSEVLAEKINNGVQIVKDGKTLLNKKDLTTFMKYAEEQVLKLIAENERKGRQVRCIDDPTVYAWAIHYFEEDSIEGNLYNEDGTKYKIEPKIQPKPVIQIKPTTPPEPKPQLNIFDMISAKNETAKVETPPKPVIEQSKPEQKQGSPMYQHYLSVKEKYKDCIVFYRLGDFYEMFNGDAVTASDILNLTLTGRDCGLTERVPMTGIPFHAVDNYISKLVAAGYKVAVCERLDGNSERTIERVITPKPTEPEQLDDDYNDLTEEEMRKFDGDLAEPDEPAEQSDDNDDFDIVTEKERLKAFDTQALCLLGELFNNEIDIQ